MKRGLIFVMLLCALSYAQGDWIMCDSVEVDIDSISVSTLDSVKWYIWQDASFHDIPKVSEYLFSVFYIDTVGWYAETLTVQVEKPKPKVPGIFYVETLELNYKNIVLWYPVLDTTYIGHFKSKEQLPQYDHQALVKWEVVKDEM